MNQMDYFFEPKSIAVVGASRNPRKVGHVVFRNFVDGGYKGKIFPVNPNADTLFGVKAHPKVSSIKEKVDLVIITVQLPAF